MQLALVLTALCTSILKPDLHPRLAETKSLTQFLSHERVGIMRFIEESLELGQLLDGKVRSRSPLLAIAVSVVPTIGS